MTTWQGLLDFALLTTTVNWLQCIYMHGHTKPDTLTNTPERSKIHKPKAGEHYKTKL